MLVLLLEPRTIVGLGIFLPGVDRGGVTLLEEGLAAGRPTMGMDFPLGSLRLNSIPLVSVSTLSFWFQFLIAKGASGPSSPFSSVIQ